MKRSKMHLSQKLLAMVLSLALAVTWMMPSAFVFATDEEPAEENQTEAVAENAGEEETEDISEESADEEEAEAEDTAEAEDMAEPAEEAVIEDTAEYVDEESGQVEALSAEDEEETQDNASTVTMDSVDIGGVTYFYANTADAADDTVYEAVVSSRSGSTTYSYAKSELTQVGATDYYYAVPAGTAFSGTLYGYGSGTATTYAEVYKDLNVETDDSYDAVTSATHFTGRHVKDIPSLVTFGTDGDGYKYINGLDLNREAVTVDAATYVEAGILNAAGEDLSDNQATALAVTLKVNPMTAPSESSVPVSVSSAAWTTSRYGIGEFAIVPDDTVDGYVWSEYWGNVYAATISDGTTTVGAVHWIDMYGEAATSGKHYNNLEIALNNGTSVGSNQATVNRYAEFFDANNNLKPGTYTINVYAEGYDTLTATVDVDSAYVLMNIPYDEFYEGEGISGVDTVTSATVKTYNTNMAGGSYHSGSLAVTDPDTDDPLDGAEIRGVTYPVYVTDASMLEGLTQVTDETEATITVASGKRTRTTKAVTGSDVLFASGDYAYYVMSDAPGNYKTLSADNTGNFSFSAVKNSAASKELKSATLAYGGHYTDLTLSVTEADDATDISGSNLSGILLTAGDETYALRHVEDVWKKTEIGWNWNGLDGNGLAGKTITNITYYMQDGGVYSYDVNVPVKTHYEGDAAAEFESSKVVAISGLPEDIENPAVTVSVTVNRVTTTLVSNAAIDDSKVTLDKAASYGTNYTVKVVSDNYADISMTAVGEWSSEAAAEDVEAAEEAVAEAKAAVETAQEAVDALAEDASAEDVAAAYEALVEAQNALTTAQETLIAENEALTKATEKELQSEINDLNGQIEDLAEQLAEAQIVDISSFAVTLGGVEGYSATYTGKDIKPAVAVAGVDASNYTVSYSNNKNAGTAKVTITVTEGNETYKGTITKTFKINKAANKLSVKGKTVTVKYSAVKKKAQTRTVSKIITFSNKGQGTKSYTLYTAKKGSTSFKKYFAINKSTGKLTIKKGLAKGTYTLKIKVKAAETTNYKESAWKTVTVKVKVN